MTCCRVSDHSNENSLLKCKATHLLTRQHSFKKSPPVNSHNKLSGADCAGLPERWKIKHKSRRVAPWLNPLGCLRAFTVLELHGCLKRCPLSVLLQLLKLDFIPSAALTQSAPITADCFTRQHPACGFSAGTQRLKWHFGSNHAAGRSAATSGACNVFSLRVFCGCAHFRSCLILSPHRLSGCIRGKTWSTNLTF